MSKLESNEIIKVLDNLIGETTAVGSSWQDDKIKKNLITLIDVTNWCLDGIHHSSKTMDRVEGSMHDVGLLARSALMELHGWLGEILNEVEQ